jgi:Domain of unknown function (DUF1707)
MSEQGHLRIGTDDRRNAVARLQLAADEGRLTAAEASGRLAAVETALTYADLDVLLRDLPPIAAPASATGWDAAHPLPIASGMSREKRYGRWEIPPYLKVSGDFGSVRLDCREAICLAPVVDIEVSAGAGSVKIIVPPGWGVDSDQVAKGWGRVRNTANRRAEPGQPQLVLHGSAGVGRLRVRTATPRRRRRSLRELVGAPAPALGWTEEHSEMPNADDLR